MDYKKYEELKKELQKLDLTPNEYEKRLKDIAERLEFEEEMKDLLKEFK